MTTVLTSDWCQGGHRLPAPAPGCQPRAALTAGLRRRGQHLQAEQRWGICSYLHIIYIIYTGQLGEILSSCEFIDAGSMDCVTGNLGLKCPLAENNFYMLIETSGSNAEHGDNKYFYNS